MNLRELAEADLAATIEDNSSGFGWPVTLTAPNGDAAEVMAFTSDISMVVDPDTGQAVSGRTATVFFRISTLTAKGIGMPRAVSQSDRRPWLVEFDDINGTPHKFKVLAADPDRTLGILPCTLGLYK